MTSTAERIESVAGINGVAVSEATWMRVRASAEFDPPETLLLKGIGEMPVYRLRRSDDLPRHSGERRNP